MIARDQLFAHIGGEAAVRRLVDRFYDLMDAEEHARTIRALHPETLEGSRDKLHWFLVGWLGGPPLYIEKFGHPRLRSRHLPFAIGDAERDQWMRCMRQALDETVPDDELRNVLVENFQSLADHMRNRER
jgi:hemoglobin